jgi:hypothetical protein
MEKFIPYVNRVSGNSDDPFPELGSLINKIVLAMSQKIDRLDPGRNPANQIADGFSFRTNQPPSVGVCPFGGSEPSLSHSTTKRPVTNYF